MTRVAWGIVALAAAQALAQAASIASNFPELPSVPQIAAGIVAVLLVFATALKMATPLDRPPTVSKKACHLAG